jgi:uncharacterized membrane protein
MSRPIFRLETHVVEVHVVSELSRSPRDMQHLHGAFGSDDFGRRAEGFARLFGTPGFLIGQTIVVALWIVINVAAVTLRWDPYPFILLNLAFSLQAAYAAPLILLAQTRQAERDKTLAESDVDHREKLAKASADRQDLAIQQSRSLHELLDANTKLTEEVRRLTVEIHRRVRKDSR